jgi:hypothetical protein
MKKMLSVLVTLLAINFLAAAGGVGWLAKSGRLDRAKLADIKKILFPPPVAKPLEATLETAATTQPTTARLDELLSQASGRTAQEQVDFIRQSFDVQVAQLDRRARELSDLQRQVDLAKQQLAHDRGKFIQDQQDLANRQQMETKLASDKGFQDSLALYTSMPPPKVKQIFMSLSDDVIEEYLQAMEPKQAAKIVKEFKSPDEVDRIQKVMEKMRLAAPPTSSPQASAKE